MNSVGISFASSSLDEREKNKETLAIAFYPNNDLCWRWNCLVATLASGMAF